jgi:hypothetical protein
MDTAQCVFKAKLLWQLEIYAQTYLQTCVPSYRHFMNVLIPKFMHRFIHNSNQF